MNLPDYTLTALSEILLNDQIMQYRTEGYIALTDLLTPLEIGQCRQALERTARELVESKDTRYTPPRLGKNNNHHGASYQRPDSASMMQLESEFDPAGKTFDEINGHVRKFMCFCNEDEVFQRLVSPGNRLGGVVSSLIGPDPILFQEMALVKPPFVGSEKPWHQDNAYFSVSQLDQVIGVWIALDDAGVENGCMHVIPGGHTEGAFRHHHGLDCEIDPGLLKSHRVRPVPIPAGGAMFFHGMIPHQTPPNRSAQRRRALQFHFRGAGTQIVDDAAYDVLFIDRLGMAASCRAASNHGF
jgi:phytanoyl-CoA hydroxylase